MEVSCLHALSEENVLRLREHFADLPSIAAVILFGSLARGQARPNSDVDLAVLFTHGRADTWPNRSSLTADVMEILKRTDVDVVILNDAPPLLAHRVVRDGHVIYSADDRAVGEFIIHAMQQFEDTRKLRELQVERLERQLTTTTSGDNGQLPK